MIGVQVGVLIPIFLYLSKLQAPNSKLTHTPYIRGDSLYLRDMEYIEYMEYIEVLIPSFSKLFTLTHSLHTGITLFLGHESMAGL